MSIKFKKTMLLLTLIFLGIFPGVSALVVCFIHSFGSPEWCWLPQANIDIVRHLSMGYCFGGITTLCLVMLKDLAKLGK